MHFEHLKITVFLDFESTHDSRSRASEHGARTGARDAEERLVSRARQAERPHVANTVSSDVLDAAACGAAAAVVTAAAALPCHSCSTLWRDPETRGAVPRAGLRRHAFAVRLAGLLLSSNEKTPPQKSCPKIARLGPPQAKEEANDKRAAGGGKN